MFDEIVKTIYPDRCEVLEIVPSHHYVYPIFKNGSSSLHKEQQLQNWSSIFDRDIGLIDVPITVFLRDPKDRFISGVNTFVQQTIRDDPTLDRKTILFFVQKYLFLNRHYVPQFFWLFNLSRFTNQPLIFKDMSEVSNLTTYNRRAGIIPPDEHFLADVADFPWDALELYFFLDRLLISRIGQTITFSEILSDFKQRFADQYTTVFQRTFALIDGMPKT